MRKFLLFITGFIVMLSSAAAQTKTAYLDLYQRGGGRHLRTDIIFDETPVAVLSRKNLGEMLNFLAERGWVVDQTMVIPRHPLGSFPVTRHKFHIILKKEYQEGENPFEGLRAKRNTSSTNDNQNSKESDNQIKVEITKQVQWREINIEDLKQDDIEKALDELSLYVKNSSQREELFCAKERLDVIKDLTSSINLYLYSQYINWIRWKIDKKEKKFQKEGK